MHPWYCTLFASQTFEGGDIEYKFLGPHQDQRKTKELQDQGKKINLSLSEARTTAGAILYTIDKYHTNARHLRHSSRLVFRVP